MILLVCLNRVIWSVCSPIYIQFTMLITARGLRFINARMSSMEIFQEKSPNYSPMSALIVSLCLRGKSLLPEFEILLLKVSDNVDRWI